MEKQTIILMTCMAAISLGMFGAYADQGRPVMECVHYLEEAKQYMDVEWSDGTMHALCEELSIEGKITIDRGNNRDIVIIWVNVGDTVRIPLLQDYVTVPSLV